MDRMTPDMPRQLSFDLPAKEVLDRADFYVAPSNAMAVAMIEASPDWPVPQMVLSGPEGSGKTHLAHVWSHQSGAGIINAGDLAQADIPSLALGPVAVEDVPSVAEDTPALEALFHLFNLSRALGNQILLTGRAAPRHWNLSLPDIQSRIDSAYHVELEPPDDTLLAAVLGKLFADRQITPKPDVIPYLVRHMERSFATARRTVDRLDKSSLDQGRTLSRSLAAQLIGLSGDNA